MEIEETTTVENNDCDFVDIGGAEQSLSHENRSWKFFNSVSLPSAEVVFFTQVCFIFILLSLSISKLSCNIRPKTTQRRSVGKVPINDWQASVTLILLVFHRLDLAS